MGLVKKILKKKPDLGEGHAATALARDPIPLEVKPALVIVD